jgi:hypothetical protein
MRDGWRMTELPDIRAELAGARCGIVHSLVPVAVGRVAVPAPPDPFRSAGGSEWLPAGDADGHTDIVSVWSMLEECVSQLDEPFRKSEIVGWFRRHYPDVKESTLAAHVQAATANAANRAQNHPYLGSRAPLLRRIDHGLYVRAARVSEADSGQRGPVAPVTSLGRDGRPGPAGLAQPPTRMRRGDRARCNLEALISDFAGCVQRFKASAVFSGPSVYFHQRAIDIRRQHASAATLLADDRFLEYVYAVLPSWGMHRMGSQAAKVAEFSQLAASLRSAVPVIDSLWPLDITRLDPADVPGAARGAWQVIAAIQASTSETQIVAGTKTLHHVLPGLIPPIDRQYTFRFFTGQKQIPSGDQRAFLEWFPYLAEIGRRCRGEIELALNHGGPMATGPAKVIDNAIIGFMQAQDTQPASLTINPDDQHI